VVIYHLVDCPDLVNHYSVENNPNDVEQIKPKAEAAKKARRAYERSK